MLGTSKLETSDLGLLTFFDSHYLPAHRLRPATIETYRGSLVLLDRFWRHEVAGRPEPDADEPAMPLASLSDQLISTWLAKLAGERVGVALTGRSIPTQNRHLRSVLAIWRFALRRAKQLGLALDPPDLSPFDEERDAPTAYSESEFARLLDAASSVRGRVGPDVPAALWWPAIVLLVYSTGVRISAAMAIRTADYHSAQRMVTVRAADQKQKKTQVFSLLDEACAVIDRIRPERLGCLLDDWPFDRTCRQWKTLNARYRRILAAAGLDDSVKDPWHQLRRTFATMVAQKAGPIVAQTLLGHSSPSVTARYLDPTKLGQPDARELLPRPQLPVQMRLWTPAAAASG